MMGKINGRADSGSGRGEGEGSSVNFGSDGKQDWESGKVDRADCEVRKGVIRGNQAGAGWRTGNRDENFLVIRARGGGCSGRGEDGEFSVRDAERRGRSCVVEMLGGGRGIWERIRDGEGTHSGSVRLQNGVGNSGGGRGIARGVGKNTGSLGAGR